MDLNIKVTDGQINITGPFTMDTNEGKTEFINFWKQFITQQVRIIMDELGDKKFGEIVKQSDEVNINAIPSPLMLNVKLNAKPDEKDQNKTHLTVTGVETTPKLTDDKFLFILGYINSGITQ